MISSSKKQMHNKALINNIPDSYLIVTMAMPGTHGNIQPSLQSIEKIVFRELEFNSTISSNGSIPLSYI